MDTANRFGKDPMAGKPLKGATTPPRPDITPQTFDRTHGATADELMWRLSWEAYGVEYR